MVHFEDKVNYLCQINNRCGIIWRIRENGVFHRENRFSTLSLGKVIFLTTRCELVLGYLLDESGIQAGHTGTALPKDLSNSIRGTLCGLYYITRNCDLIQPIEEIILLQCILTYSLGM